MMLFVLAAATDAVAGLSNGAIAVPGSRALPLLYVNKLAAAEALPIDLNVQARIADAIERVKRATALASSK